jgi:hypothetical protein
MFSVKERRDCAEMYYVLQVMSLVLVTVGMALSFAHALEWLAWRSTISVISASCPAFPQSCMPAR